MLIPHDTTRILKIDQEIFVEMGIKVGGITYTIKFCAVARRENHTLRQSLLGLAQKGSQLPIMQIELFSHLDRSGLVI